MGKLTCKEILIKVNKVDLASWEDNETRKEPDTIYLFLSTSGEELR
jgi:hypothetical protein